MGVGGGEVYLRVGCGLPRLLIVSHPVPVDGVVLREAVIQPHLLDGHAAADADGFAGDTADEIIRRFLGGIEIAHRKAPLLQGSNRFLDVHFLSRSLPIGFVGIIARMFRYEANVTKKRPGFAFRLTRGRESTIMNVAERQERGANQ